MRFFNNNSHENVNREVAKVNMERSMEEVKVLAHIAQIKSRRDFLKRKLESGEWVNTGFAVAEYEALEWVLKEMNR